ncbi:DUF4178 domain-containing protein [Jannaschia donghaensis]|uniref:DUF4178 domain-containing protein n=1 Tax=Jannaschia donghaensis TaxID=420998 RepID=A0A0M6YIG3_9RHOB|nr:DUF4178 domain-containing protein [Jannaschia donghaensis]CTQ50141.1 hypothetical protein JDO7802_02159 [Jannaschia donghaensis]
MTGTTRAIDCTNCGAGLAVLGGGRVNTQVCGYCGASLDANDAYRVLKVWDGMERPSSPFGLGMTGAIDGVTFTVIGTLGQREVWGRQVWEWVDHQLFSPTHGYAWLTVEDGHCVLTRKLRDGPMHSFLTSAKVERAETPPRLSWKGTRYRYYATTNWETTYVEGEFNWRPERGRTGTTVTVMSDDPADGMLAFVEPVGGAEREIERSHLWPGAQAAFGVEAPVRVHGQHPLQDIKAAIGPMMIAWFAGLAVAAVALGFVVVAMQPDPQRLFSGSPQDLPPEIVFAVSDTTRPARVELFHDLRNAFAGYEVQLTAPDGTALADTYREISYYSGGSGEDSWSEGSRSQTLNFVPPMAGDYTLSVASESGGATSGAFRVTFREGRLNAFWLWAAAGLFGLCAAAIPFFGLAKRSARWKGSDWSSEG